MARELVPLKVKIKLDTNGHALYPAFNNIPSIIRHGLDWSKYIDVYGAGWHYDKTSGHKEETLDSPFGQQWGVLLVPQDFATAAITLFPDEVTELTELELEDFYNNKAHIKEPDELFDNEILAGIKMKQDLSLALTTEQVNALDPKDDTPGIRKNKRKVWADYKILTGITIPAK